MGFTLLKCPQFKKKIYFILGIIPETSYCKTIVTSTPNVFLENNETLRSYMWKEMKQS